LFLDSDTIKSEKSPATDQSDSANINFLFKGSCNVS